MFLIASATTLSTISAVLMSFRRLFNSDHQYFGHAARADHANSQCRLSLREQNSLAERKTTFPASYVRDAPLTRLVTMH